MIELADYILNFERNVYDVDAFEILDRLRDKYLKEEGFVTEQMLLLEEENLLQLLDAEGYNTKERQKYRNFILPSNFNHYNNFLAYKLLTIDPYDIKPLLSYQSVLFLGNDYAVKENFTGLLWFLVYHLVQKRVLPNEQIRLEKIVNWLEEKFKDIKKNDSQNKSEVLKTIKDLFTDPEKWELYTNVLCEVNPPLLKKSNKQFKFIGNPNSQTGCVGYYFKELKDKNIIDHIHNTNTIAEVLSNHIGNFKIKESTVRSETKEYRKEFSKQIDTYLKDINRKIIE